MEKTGNMNRSHGKNNGTWYMVQVQALVEALVVHGTWYKHWLKHKDELLPKRENVTCNQRCFHWLQLCQL